MYAAAGGASIANRRKQKQLQLNRRAAEGTAAHPVASRVKGASSSHASKFARPHVFPPSSAHQPPPAQLPAAYRASVDHRRRRGEQRQHRRHQDYSQPSIQFPISPPPLSLESPSSVTHVTKSNNFSFSPPPVLDFRISSTDLQCGGQGPGKAAWQGCNRPSPLPLSPVSPHDCRGDGYKTKQCEAHRRWMKRNRIRDASYCYGSSGEDDDDERNSSLNRHHGEVSAAVNTVLYAGLGTTALGLVISFVGTGEKGFLSPELKLVGPSLLCAGVLCCLFRVLLCLCLCRCGECRWRFCRVPSGKHKEKSRKVEVGPGRPLPTTTLLSPPQQPTISTCPVSLVAKGHELLLSPAQLPE